VSHLICLSMVKRHPVTQRDPLISRTTRMSCQRNKNRRLKSALGLFKNSGLAKSPNPRQPCCSNRPYPMMTQTTRNSCPPMSRTSTCSRTSNDTEMVMSKVSTTSNDDLKEHLMPPADVMLPSHTEMKQSLIERISDNVHCQQTAETMNTPNELALTMTRCPGMSRMNRTTTYCPYHRLCRKPSLYSRISLATSKGHDLPCSTAIDQSHNSRKLSGSTYSAETQSTSTMYSQISTRSPTAQTMSLNSGKTSNCFKDLQHLPKLSKPMETGLSPGTALLKPLSSYSNTEDRNCSLMENTSNDTSPRCPLNSTAGLSTMTVLSESEQLNDEISNSPISPNLQTYRSNGSVVRQPFLQGNRRHQIPRTQRIPSPKVITNDVPRLVEDGMKVNRSCRATDGIRFQGPKGSQVQR
jgi:hypothetical protein